MPGVRGWFVVIGVPPTVDSSNHVDTVVKFISNNTMSDEMSIMSLKIYHSEQTHLWLI